MRVSGEDSEVWKGDTTDFQGCFPRDGRPESSQPYGTRTRFA
jgi:hypothetical protein